MAGIDKPAIYSMTDDDATLNRLRRRVLLLVLKIYKWNLLDRRRRDMMRLPVKKPDLTTSANEDQAQSDAWTVNTNTPRAVEFGRRN
ncbi:hypothetical protein PENSOL_c001G07544 [Penicillium solitum]|uniref:Uncharacterized protein n=1 Tax=Penicillium solitum TaxID=60172 RepID=A0A1V6RQ28_9EURO|nr:uncharacterized protein PENSOL_c001G07544 [Penicillium solitum]OQE03549.1 hypothetical protein PENSOL_c001G07544 [Penicillium solitum]